MSGEIQLTSVCGNWASPGQCASGKTATVITGIFLTLLATSLIVYSAWNQAALTQTCGPGAMNVVVPSALYTISIPIIVATVSLAGVAYLVVTYVGAINKSQPLCECKAPIAGKCIKINYAVGDRVEKGSVVCVLEAMKMEYSIAAQQSGVLTSVACEAGVNCPEQALLFTIRPN